MKKEIVDAVVVEQKPLSADINLITVKAPAIASQAEAGQFVNVEVSGQVAPLLRRPFGIAMIDEAKECFTMIYRVLGEGTQILAQAKPGDVLSIVGPLGHGFDLAAKRPLLVGGGLGLAPILALAGSFQGKADVLIGCRNCQEIFWGDFYQDKVQEIFYTTDDGSHGTKGNVNALLPELLASGKYDCVYVCGPEVMMKAVAKVAEAAKVPCQVSLEKYMACGLGACLSCSCGGVHKRMKVCTDGPVFWAQEVAEW